MTRRKMRHRRRTEAELWAAERYKSHHSYSPRELRKILTEDACMRWPTPLAWMIPALEIVAASEGSTPEVVFLSIRSECLERTGLDMPFAGLR